VRSGEDRVRSSEDRVRSTENRVRSSEDRVRSTEDRVRSGEDRVRSSEDRVKSSEDRVRSDGSSSKASASSPSGVRRARSSRHGGERPESRAGRGGRSVIVSPTSSVTSDSDQPPPLSSSTLQGNSAEWKPRDVVSTWSPSQLNSTRHSPPHKVCSTFIALIHQCRSQRSSGSVPDCEVRSNLTVGSCVLSRQPL